VSPSEAKKLLLTDPDFVYLKKYDFSLKKVLQKYPDGAPDRVIAQALMISEEEVQDLYESIIDKIRQSMRVDLD
jgi:hypothetical protein